MRGVPLTTVIFTGSTEAVASGARVVQPTLSDASNTTDSSTPPTTGGSSMSRQEQVTVTAPTLFDVTGLHWPTVPAAFVPPEGTAVGGGSSKRVVQGTVNASLVQFGVKEGDECSLDLAAQEGLLFCDTGLVRGATASQPFLPFWVHVKRYRAMQSLGLTHDCKTFMAARQLADVLGVPLHAGGAP